MRKYQEVSIGDSCLNRAGSRELLFVLLSRDACAPVAIRAWVEARILSGKNKRTDPQMVEALMCADAMESERGEYLDPKDPDGAKGPAPQSPVLAALILAQSALRRWTDLYAKLQNECGEVVSRKLDYNLPPADHVRALEAIAEAFEAVKVAPSSARRPEDIPVCDGHAEAWFCGRNHLPAGFDYCIACCFLEHGKRTASATRVTEGPFVKELRHKCAQMLQGDNHFLRGLLAEITRSDRGATE